MFNKEEISKRVLECFNQIQIPFNRLQEIDELIQYIVSSMKQNLMRLDPW